MLLMQRESSSDLWDYLRQGGNKIVYYQGESELNSEPIFAVLLTNPKNKKTGAIPHTTILPIEGVVQTPAVCGDCPFLKSPKSSKRSCYVTPYQIQQFKQWQEKREQLFYLNWDNDFHLEIIAGLFGGLLLRQGNSGDPLAVPLAITMRLNALFKNTLVYTHQASNYIAQYQNYQLDWLVSTHSYHHAKNLQERGIRTARVVHGMDSQLTEREIICPHMTGQVLTCEHCQLCTSNHPDQPSIVFPKHGPRTRWLDEFPGMT